MKIVRIVLIIITLAFALTGRGESAWPYGKELTQQQADSLMGQGAFVPVSIDEALKNRIVGKSMRHDAKVAFDDLRYIPLLHRDAAGRIFAGEMICGAVVAQDLQEIFRELYDSGYPIERMVLIDEYDADDVKSMAANNSSCFNYREIAGSTKLSKHSRGMAVDINPLYNPYVKGEEVSPPSGRKYADRNVDSPYRIKRGDRAHRLFMMHGFKWGGDWKSLKDWQHFEK